MSGLGLVAGILISNQLASGNSSEFRPINIGGGIIIEQVYVNDDHAKKSWRIDGTPLKKWIATAEMRSRRSRFMPHRWNLYVRFRHSEFIIYPSVILQPNRGALVAVQGQREVFDLHKDDEEFAIFPIESISTVATEFRIGIEGGKWNDVTIYENRTKHFELVKGSPFDFVVSDPAGFYGRHEPGDIGVTIPRPFGSELRCYRVAFTRGTSTWCPQSSFFGSSSLSREFDRSNWYRGPSLRGDKIALQTRGYVWSTIKRAVLRPGSSNPN